MCGIVGYVGDRSCRELLMHGLERLEYRGYDSAGTVAARRRRDRVGARGRQPEPPPRGRRRSESNGGGTARRDPASPTPTTGIGHTRWATHGQPSERNAHPHPDCTGRVHIVLNGIIENYVELRAALEAEGHDFASETDAEAVAHLIEKHLDALGPGRLPEATRLAYLELRGHYAFVAISRGRARDDRRRPQGVPAGRRRRRRRALHRLRDPRLPARDPQRAARQRRRDRDRAQRIRRRSGAPRDSRSSARSRRSPGTRMPPRRPATRLSC